MPCLDRFLAQAAELRQAVIGDAPVKVAVEAGIRQGWDAVIGTDGAFVGMSSFGASAPYQELYRHFGITPEKVAEAALSTLGK
jgi:transketolase